MVDRRNRERGTAQSIRVEFALLLATYLGCLIMGLSAFAGMLGWEGF